jgi:SAM-dependent methyltransferase
MTTFEQIYRCVRISDHPLYQRVFGLLTDLQRRAGRPLKVLDVGGRRSNYTIGLGGEIIISDLPRETEVQHALDLGTTEEMRSKVMRKRSNIRDYIWDDMTKTKIPEHAFDVVVAVEVLEHVEEDEAFVRNVARVLRPGGAFVMTTPNGDFLRVPYADHKRHYERAQLAGLLDRYFSSSDVHYAVNHSKLINFGAQPLSLKAPVKSLLRPAALFLSARLEALGVGGAGPEGKRHLVAVARK